MNDDVLAAVPTGVVGLARTGVTTRGGGVTTLGITIIGGRGGGMMIGALHAVGK